VGQVQIQFAIDDPDRADAIVESLLDRRLVACGQRAGPVRSRFRWQGSMETAEEWLVLLKTRSELVPRVIDAVVAEHPYENPEVVAMEFTQGAPSYLGWIDDVTAGTPVTVALRPGSPDRGAGADGLH
jgi:periplasmic divalent cation tolerance protein